MTSKDFHQFIESLTTGFTPVIAAEFREEDYLKIDLSSGNSALSLIDITSPAVFERYLKDELKKANKKIAYGGYIENRQLYERSQLFNAVKESVFVRNIHIGLDIWAEAGTTVLAPLKAKIHSFQNNALFGDYGPTVILEHTLQKRRFYTLYGHLSRKSLDVLSVGKSIKKGEKFAELGAIHENGDYAPHLHFQIIEDLENHHGDYPGVVSTSNLSAYLNNCPDPNSLLKIG